MDHEYKIASFSFFTDNRFFKYVNWSSIPNPNFKFIPYFYVVHKEKMFFEGFCPFWNCSCIIQADDDLSKKFSWEEKSR